MNLRPIGRSRRPPDRAFLARRLSALRAEAVALEARSRAALGRVHPAMARSAANLLHYVALRRHDIRDIQPALAELGLSSLGRAEPGVLGTIDAVLAALGAPAAADGAGVGVGEGRELLERHARDLLGARAAERAAPGRGPARRARIMVTMPTEAAHDAGVVRGLLESGMDCARINAAHDGPEVWEAIAGHVREAAAAMGRECRVLVDLPGPKLRTGPVAQGPAVVKLQPERDELGRMIAPARVVLAAEGAAGVRGSAALPVRGRLDVLGRGAVLRFRDARGKKRELAVEAAAGPGGVRAAIEETAYLVPGITLHGEGGLRLEVGDLPRRTRTILLRPGDVLRLTRGLTPGEDARRDARGRATRPAHIGCTLPRAFRDARPGHAVWLDDGKIGGVVRRVGPASMDVEITHARASGERLGPDKGINLPDTELRLPSLTAADLACLPFAARHADMIGLSFVRSPEDVARLLARVAALGERRPGVVLKIETRRAFDRLPSLMLAAMAGPTAGVMIARGDLAIEVGYERLAEVQEEILWLCEAAHVPVIWATQVLDRLAKTGLPTRAEITDAAMSGRAECVMLNKGPFVARAVRTLDDILRRMEAHQAKKSARLRPLKLATRFAGRR